MPALDRALIDADADRVVRRLARAGHKAYLVGGCVRDLLLGRKPKDFDLATSATPNEIKALFRNSRIIGRRFRLAHVFFGQKIIETATFRANPTQDEDGGDLLIRRDNIFGTESEDALRRDFTINGLFYDVEREEVIDHVGGLADLEARLIRTIGDPEIRFQEDPVRILRAIKFAARLGLAIEPATYRALVRWRGEIRKCSAPRVLEEVLRLLRGGAAHRSLEILIETATLEILSTHLAELLEGPGAPVTVSPAAIGPETGTRALTVAHEAYAEPDELAAQLDAEEQAWHRVWADAVEPQPGTARIPLRLSFVHDRAEIEKRRKHTWATVAQVDAYIGAGREPTNALVLCCLVAPFLLDTIIAPGSRPGDANNAILEIGQPLVDQLRVARRDAERLRQILLALRRIVPARRRRGNLDGLAGRDVIEDGVMLHELLERAAGHFESDPTALLGDGTAPADVPTHAADPDAEGEPEDGDADADGKPEDGDASGEANGEDGPRKRRRRRRGGRGR